MSSSLRSLLVLLAVFVMAANVQAAAKKQAGGKKRHPATHQTHKAPRHVSHTKVTHHRRPAVHRRPVQHARRRTTPNARGPVKRTVVRTVHRYPVHRVQRRFVVRPYSFGPHARRHHHHRRYTYFYYPGRYVWRTSHYNRGYGVSRRRPSRGVAGIVESVQGNAGNGTLLVKVLRPRHSRFHYAAARKTAGRGATSQHRFHLNNGTRYQIMTAPPKRGSIADLHKGERVLILRHAKAANTAQKVEVFARRKR